MDIQTMSGASEFQFDEAKLPGIEWLAEQMPQGFFICSAKEPGEILYINRAACRMFGCSDADDFKINIGTTFFDMVHPDDLAKTRSTMDAQAEGNAAHRMDHVQYRIVRKDGEVRTVEDHGHPANFRGAGEVYCVFIGDITARRGIEEEKKRGSKLAYALEAQKEANVAKTAFLSNMSHEIRTPITAILGMNDIIRRESRDDQVLTYSDNIRKAGKSLLGIINDILDFSKIEAGKLTIVPGEYSMPELIGDLYNVIQFRAEEKGLSIHLEIDHKLPSKLIGDDLRLKQILVNLLTNAIDYTEEGSVTLHISVKENKGEDTVRLFVMVRDTGIGIKEDEMDQLFSAFDQPDTGQTQRAEGSGLGLAICRKLLHLMDSHLYVHSKYNEGSSFYFEIDQRVADTQPAGDFSVSRQVAEVDAVNTSTFSFTAPASRILVVDDTPMNLEVIAGLLKPTQIAIDLVESGASCIEKFAACSYDLVFLDYRMPRMDGIETLNGMKERSPQKFAETPVISLTANAISGERERMIAAGFTDYLTKPINIADMQQMLLTYLPEEKVVFLEQKPPPEKESDPLEGIPKEAFPIPWLDPMEGVEFCGSAAMYVKALGIFANSIDEKAALIGRCAQEGDIRLYTVILHSLKSTALTIGAAAFSERAKELELAGKREDIEMIRRETPRFLDDYKALKQPLWDVVGHTV